MLYANIIAEFSCERVDLTDIATKLARLFSNLKSVHTLVAEFSAKGSKGGYNNMLEEPLVEDMSREDWATLFEADGGNASLWAMEFWNRRQLADEALIVAVAADTGYCGSCIAFTEIPERLNTETCLLGMLAASLNPFGVSRGYIRTFHGGHTDLIRNWALWLKTDQPAPSTVGYGFEIEQGLHSVSKEWMNGTLYIWPEYEPWAYRPMIAAS